MRRKKRTKTEKRGGGANTSARPSPADQATTLSLCLACAKHPSLKRFVQHHGEVGHECGICHRKDQVATLPGVHAALLSLVRALIRFYYHEWVYNGHWGGDQEPESLLCHENEIVEHVSAPGFRRSQEESEPFLMTLFEPPYPDYDKGIALYAGHHEEYGRLPPLSAIGSSESPVYADVADRLNKQNYFEVQDLLEEHLAKFDTELVSTLPRGTVLFRARLGVAKKLLRTFEWEAETLSGARVKFPLAPQCFMDLRLPVTLDHTVQLS